MASIKKWLDVDLNVIEFVLDRIAAFADEKKCGVFRKARCREFGLPASICNRLATEIEMDSGVVVNALRGIDLLHDMIEQLPVTAPKHPSNFELIQAIRDSLQMKTETLEEMLKRKKKIISDRQNRDIWREVDGD